MRCFAQEDNSIYVMNFRDRTLAVDGEDLRGEENPGDEGDGGRASQCKPGPFCPAHEPPFRSGTV